MNPYLPLIRSIRLKRNITIVATSVALLLLLLFGVRTEISILGFYYYNEGIHPFPWFLLLFSILFLGFLIHTIVSSPIDNALNVECDPEKHLALCVAFRKKDRLAAAYLDGCFMLGDFDNCLRAINDLDKSKNAIYRPICAFQRARIGFFTKDTALLKEQTALFMSLLATVKMNAAQKALFEKMAKYLSLLIALADECPDVSALADAVEPWGASRITVASIHYVKGLVAVRLGERDLAVYHFYALKEEFPKLFYAKLAEEQLKTL